MSPMRTFAALAFVAVASAMVHIPMIHKPKSLQHFHAMTARRVARFANVEEVATFPSVPLTDIQDSEYFGEATHKHTALPHGRRPCY